MCGLDGLGGFWDKKSVFKSQTFAFYITNTEACLDLTSSWLREDWVGFLGGRLGAHSTWCQHLVSLHSHALFFSDVTNLIWDSFHCELHFIFFPIESIFAQFRRLLLVKNKPFIATRHADAVNRITVNVAPLIQTLIILWIIVLCCKCWWIWWSIVIKLWRSVAFA